MRVDLAVCGAALCAGGIVAGCGPRAIVPDPRTISLKSALTEVGEGLAAMVQAQHQQSDFGIYPAEVTVTFNVSASATAGSSLMVTPGFPTLTPVTERVGMQATNTDTASRGNTVCVKFVNILFAPPEALVQHLSGAQLYELRLAMQGIDPRGGFVPVSVTGSSADVAGNSAQAPPGEKSESTLAVIDSPSPAASAAPTSARLPAMKFLSPFRPEEDPSELLRSLTVEQVRSVALVVNERVGMMVVDPNATEADLRTGVLGAATRLGWKKQALLQVLATMKR